MMKGKDIKVIINNMKDEKKENKKAKVEALMAKKKREHLMKTFGANNEKEVEHFRKAIIKKY